MQIGIDSFAAAYTETSLSAVPADRLSELLEQVERADEAGLDVFGIGEHHRQEYLDSAPAIILAAAAARTRRIRLTSAVAVLSAIDPVRLFQQFATLDLVSRGRAEMVVGRGSFIDAFPLFGLRLEDYDSLFEEHLELLLNVRSNEHVSWSGRHRPALTGQGVYPRPVQNPLPIWVGVGGTPKSFARAGALGLPLMVAIIGGEPRRFKPLIDLYRSTGVRFGHAPDQLKVGVHSLGYVAKTKKEAADDFFPGYARAIESVAKERGWSSATSANLSPVRLLFLRSGAAKRRLMPALAPGNVAKTSDCRGWVSMRPARSFDPCAVETVTRLGGKNPCRSWIRPRIGVDRI
jgi:probable LLM family oxidoreductase